MSMARVWVLLCVLLGAGMASAQVERFVEGSNYFTLKSPQETRTGAKVEVLEVFNYACVHCGHLDPVLVEWARTQPAEAQLRYLPAAWPKPAWREYAATYFAAEKLGVIERSHHALFDLMYVQNKAPQTLDEVAAFFTQFGVKAEDFKAALESPEVAAKMEEATRIVGNYEVEGTPTLIVDGRWRFDVTSAGGPQQVGPLINHLVDRALKLRNSKSAP